MRTEKEIILGFPKEAKIQILKDMLEQNKFGLFLSFSNILLEAPLNEGGLETEIIESIHNEYLLANKKRWLKNKIIAHWQSFGKFNPIGGNSVTVARNFKNNRVVVDYGNGGSCTTYDYDGKWIAG